MTVNTKTIGIIIAALLIWIFLQNSCDRNINDTEVISVDTTEVEVDTPEIIGSIPQPTIKYIEVETIKYVPIESKEDKELIAKYEKANDSLKKELYKAATTVNTYNETFEDDNLKVELTAKANGTIDSLSISSYTIKENKATVPLVTKTVEKKKNTLSASGEIGVPTRFPNPLIFKAGLELENKKGMTYKLGYDSEQNMWVGLKVDIF